MIKFILLLLLVGVYAGTVPEETNTNDVVILSSSEIKCHACLDIHNTSAECMCEAAKCAFRTSGWNSSVVLERFCPKEKWAIELLEDGCITYEGQYICYCSSDFCNANNISSIRGDLNCSSQICPNNSVCYDTLTALKCTCPPWDPSCEDRATRQCTGNRCQNNCCATLNCNYGYCVNNNGVCSCICPINYTGTNCQTPIIYNPCSNYQCLNGGTVVNYNGVCSCCCPASFTGLYCQTAITCCSSYVCYNGGTCRASANGQVCTCACPGGFTGAQCQTPIPDCCSTVSCQNGGICQNTNGVCGCCCPTGFSGTNCEIKNPCYPNPCANGGLCTALPNNLYKCTCAPGFTGPTCTVIDCCSSCPCNNGGTCFNDNGKCYCLCLEGYLGDFCQQYDCCLSNPCKNGGTCFFDQVNNNCLCLCQLGFLGNYCEICDCCWNQPCQNGGTCVNNNGTCYCNCPTGFKPPSCDVDKCYQATTTTTTTTKCVNIKAYENPTTRKPQKGIKYFFEQNKMNGNNLPQGATTPSYENEQDEEPSSPFSFAHRPHNILYGEKFFG